MPSWLCHGSLLIRLRFHCILIYFFKQKTAYEMRISDWSSDVCSSDLCVLCVVAAAAVAVAVLVPDLPDLSGALSAALRRLLRWAVGRSSEERRVGKECVSTRRSRWSQYP